MRVTQSMYYKNLYAQNNSQINSKLFDVNKQIASGLKIQHAHDDVLTFSDTMRLDNEITTLGQIRKSTESGYKMSNQTDSILNDFTQTLNRTKTLLIQAANDTQSATSRDAIAAELRGLEDHFKNLSNTSINGQYLFSGTAVKTKPIADDGTYMGNNQSMNAFLGSKVEQTYNLSGADLFLGEESLVKRQITTNVAQYNLSAQYPDFTNKDSDVYSLEEIITTENTIRDLMGAVSDDVNTPSHFYIRGTNTSGEAFSKQVSMNDSETVGELLTQIGNAFGNTSDRNLVNVSLTQAGLITVEDKMSGSSKLDFHMVGAVDFDHSDGDAADVNSSMYGATSGKIDHLAAGETDFNKIIKSTSTAENSNLYVKKFVQSAFEVSLQDTDLIRAEYTITPSLSSPSVISITINDKAGVPTTYDVNPFNTDAPTTYIDLKTAIESNGDFTVSISGDEIILNTTTQGVEKGVFIQSGLASTGAEVISSNEIAAAVATDASPIIYDRTMFTQNGSTLNSTTPQVLRSTNAFADESTKISQVADISRSTADTADDGLTGAQFKLEGNSVNGAAYTALIDFNPSGSQFIVDTTGDGTPDTPYVIYNTALPRTAVDAEDMTYRQMMDVVNMLATGTLPSAAGTHTHSDGTAFTDAEEYDYAIESSTLSGQTSLSYDGKITFKDMHNSDTKANISLYDANSGDFSPTNKPSVLTFNSNNALSISDPKTDFFKRLDEIISAVEQNKMHPDGTNGNDPRNVGMSSAITMIDDLAQHVTRSQSQVGANSNSLTSSIERTTLLEVSTKVLRSSVVEVDLAEASLQLTQLSLNYEAMLATVGKISKLSLVNYL